MRRAKRALDGLEDDIRDHIDCETQDNIDRGMAPEEARRQALLKFGNVALAQEDSRAVWTQVWLEQLLLDARYAFRTFRQLPGFALMALLILALGVGATTVMFTVINSVLLRPLAYPQPDRLVTLREVTEAFGESRGTSYPDFIDFQSEIRSLTMAAWRYGGGTVSDPGEPEYVNGREISAALFDVLGVRLSQGRPFRSDDDRQGAAPVAIISHSLWQRRFGGGVATGQRLVFEGRPYTVVGLAPLGFGLDGDADVLTPLGQNTDPRMRNRNARFLRITARLVDGVTFSETQAELAVIARRLAAQFPESNTGRGMVARSLQQDVVGNIGSTLWLLLAAVTLVLLIACVNVASLLLARAVSRERELATRVALGASRARVVRQCLTESAVLGLIGGSCGIVLATLTVGRFVEVWPSALPRANEIALDWRVLLAAFAVSLVSGLAFGLAPAMRVPMSSVESVLRGASRATVGSSRRPHSTFVVIQLALAVVLLVSAGMLARTLVGLVSLDPGLNVRNVLTARFALSPGVLGNAAQIPGAWRDVLDRARRIPGIESAALTDIVPMRVGENALPYWTTAAMPPRDQMPIALASSVTPDYVKVMGIPLHAGRFFEEHDRLDGDPVVVIDEHLALHAFGRKEVVGRQLWVPAMGPAPVRIVGVVGHVRHWGLAADDRSQVRDQMYYPLAQVPRPLLRTFASFLSIVVRTRIAPLDVVERLRRELRGTSGDQSLYEVRTMEQLVNRSLARERFLALLFGLFGGVALLLSCVGLYGVVAYLTGQRRREFGVRMALGATAGEVMRLVMRQSAALIVIGVILGTGAAWVAARLLERFAEGIQSLEPETVAVMTSVLVVTALSASAIPACRAGRADAIQALRHD
jgi:putative ABC transport system permease protein